MNDETHKNNQIRNYLLGKITHEEELEKIENQMMDDDFFEQLTIVETEIIEDYVNQRLAPDEIESFQTHFLVSDERRERIKFAQALRHYVHNNNEQTQKSVSEEASSGLLFFFKTWLTAPVATGLLFVILASVGVYLFLTSANNEVLAQLNKAYKTERPFEARISGLDYAPLNNRRGGNNAAVDANARNYAQILSHAALEKKPSAQNLHNLGRVYLAEEKFDEAIKQLEAAEKADAENAELLTDLGTAYFEKSKTLAANDGKQMELATSSLGYFERALKIKSDLPEALFNRAACLQHLNLSVEAIEAWNEYLKIDDRSSWADEARKNLQAISESNSQTKNSQEILQDFLTFHDRGDHENAWLTLSRNREMITGKLIPQQLAVLFLKADENEKGKYLAALKYAGELSRSRSKDPFFAEIAQFYADAPAEKLQLLMTAQEAVKKGFDSCNDENFLVALDNFKIARQNFADAGNQNELELNNYWISYCDFQTGSIKQSTSQLEALETRAKKNNHQWLLATVLARLANNYSALDDYSKVIQYNQDSLALAEKTDDLFLRQRTLSQISNKYLQLKRFDKAFEYMQKSFQLLALPETSARQRWRTYEAAGQLLIQAKLYAAAAAVTQEALKLNDEKTKEGTFNYGNYYQLSRIYGEQKDFPSAFKYANLSIAAAENVKDVRLRSKGEAATILNLAHLQRQTGNCNEAITNYDRALKISQSVEFSLHKYDTEKGRLLCYYSNQDKMAFAEKLPEVLQMFEQNRAKILEEQNRNTFFDQEQSVYDLAIDYEAAQGNAERAFNYSEQSRSRSLLDLQKSGAQISFDQQTPQIVLNSQNSKPLDLSVLQPRIPDREQIVQYAVVKDRVLIWLITKNNFRQFISETSAEVLRQKVEDFLGAIRERNTNQQRELSQELYRILFQPVEDDLNSNNEVCIVPDKILSYLPFDALISTRSNDYLLADYRLLTAPSANIFLTSSETAKKAAHSRAEQILSVGNPVFDRQGFSSLSPLPSARREAVTVANYYASSKPLLEDAATKTNFLSRFPEADVVHFAGHYVVDQHSPMLSGLLMTGSGSEGMLTNYELLKLGSAKPKLIVLSACETGVEKYYDGEGMISAGRTFLALDVPLIVVSGWQVDSDATAELMSEMHRRRVQDKVSTVEALRLAQLEMIRHGREDFRQPFYWAGFSVIGGAADF